VRGLVCQARDALLFDPSVIPPPIPYAVSTSLVCPSVIQFNWLDATGGTNTGLKLDDGSVSVPLPFNFIFNGQSKSNAVISTNGYLTFGTIGYAYNNTSIPLPASPNDLIAPFWDDLNSSAGDSIYYATFGSAPNRVFVVEWSGIPRYPAEGALTFEAALFEGSNNILLQYQTLAGPNASGASATVGIEYATGASGVLYAYNTPGSLQEGLAIRFSPITSGPALACAPWIYYFPIVSK